MERSESTCVFLDESYESQVSVYLLSELNDPNYWLEVEGDSTVPDHVWVAIYQVHPHYEQGYRTPNDVEFTFNGQGFYYYDRVAVPAEAVIHPDEFYYYPEEADTDDEELDL